MRSRALIPLLLLVLLAPLPVRAAPQVVTVGDVTAEIGTLSIKLSNGIVERSWAANSLQTLSAGRTGNVVTQPADDFALIVDGVTVTSGELATASVTPEAIDDGVRLTWILGSTDALHVKRVVELYQGIAGFKTQTTISSLVPLALSGYTLDTASVVPDPNEGPRTTIQSFRAGADWREPGWSPQSIGDPHTGDWRVESNANDDEPLSATGQWMSIDEQQNDRRVAFVSERRDYASSRMTYEGSPSNLAHADVDLSRDVVYIGPFEESGHVENPGPGPARHRVVAPGAPLVLEPAFTIYGRDADDEAWQFHKYLTQHRLGAYPKRVMFNSDGVDTNAISTGAKDDMNYERFHAIVDEVKEMGIDTFIFDDGWMARSGDWCPDSPSCPEPRWDGQPGTKFRPRFNDATFAQVRGELGDMELGLWMNPMEFNPSSKAFQTNPQWACMPVGDALAVYNVAEPNDGSNEAGLGVWNPLAMGVNPDNPTEPMRMIDYMEGRIMRAIDVYQARYFKFDFLVWVDCGGAFPVTMYEYHDAFVDMIDRVQAARPNVTISIDETNDYRMFPFESTARGPAWFLNGGPSNTTLLHTIWKLSPYVPGYSLGMRSLAQPAHRATLEGVDRNMAASLLGHITFSFPVDAELDATKRARVKKWVDFYHANRDTLAGMTYPLLSDPLSNDWTALQSWNGDTQSGWLLAYRQNGASTQQLAPLKGLGGVPGDTLFDVQLVDPANDASALVGTFTAAELVTGLDVQIAQPGGYAIYRITRA